MLDSEWLCCFAIVDLATLKDQLMEAIWEGVSCEEGVYEELLSVVDALGSSYYLYEFTTPPRSQPIQSSHANSLLSLVA